MNFTHAVKSAFSRYWDYKGRSSRSEFWYFVLFHCLASFTIELVAIGFFFIHNGDFFIYAYAILTVISFLYSIFIFIPHLFLTIRRLHDIGRSGWWMFISLTLIGIPISLYMLVTKSDEGPNKYGPPPYSPSVTPDTV